MMTVNKIMTRVSAVRMPESRSAGSEGDPSLGRNRRKKIVGILSARDLLRNLEEIGWE
jgi:hypothetical protein